jgi:uncharacterized repeat protein (TIGR01451 family)
MFKTDSCGRKLARLLKFALVLLSFQAAAAMAQSADLVLNHFDTPDPGPAGGIFTYTLRIDNNGPNPAGAITLNDTLPAGSQFIDATPSAGGACPTVPAAGADGAVSCNWPGLAFTAPITSTASVAIRVRLPAAGVWTNTATVLSVTADPNAANNTNNANQTTAVAAADLRITASASAANVAAGQPFSYSLVASNLGPNPLPVDATQSITFTVPAGAAVTGIPTGTGWTCTPSAGYPLTAGNIACVRTGGLASGATAPTLTVPAVANALGNISAAFATGATKVDATPMPDGDPTNNTANADVTVAAGSDLSITKGANPTVVAQGNTVTYTLVPRLNGGLSPAPSGADVITVTDVLGADLAFVSAAGAGWTCGAVANVVTCTMPGPYAGANFANMATVTIVATALNSGTLSNQATVNGPVSDPVPANNFSAINVVASNEADLRINKSASLNPLAPGQAFSYFLSTTNLGILPVASTQVIRITDTFPANVELTGTPTGTGWACTPNAGFPIAGAVIDCVRNGPLAVNAATPNITVPARMPAAGTATNTACVFLNGAGPTDTNASGGVNCVGLNSTTSGTEADLVLVSKTANPPSTVSGETLTYVITVRNDGPASSTNVTVTDQLASLLPAGGFISAVATQGTCTPNSTTPGPTVNLSCNLGTLAPAQTESVTVRVRPVVALTGNRVNTARVFSTDIGDPVQTNNTGSVTSQVTASVNVGVTKTATPLTVPAGAPITFQATVGNSGPSTASTVTMVDTLPANAAFIDLQGITGGGTCTTVPAAGAVGGTLACRWASIANGVQRTVSYRMRPLGTAAGGTVTNAVAVATVTPETTLIDNTATTSTPVTTAQLDILVNKDDSVDPVDLGQLTTYTVTITNGGPSFGTNVRMTDVFPAPGNTPTAVFSYLGNLTVNASGSCSSIPVGALSGTLTCTFPTLASGQSAVVTYQMRAETLLVPGATSGTGFNRVSVAVDEPETTLANNVVLEDTTARRLAVPTDLSIVKTATPTVATPGQNLTFNLLVRNNGPQPSDGAQVIDNIPAGLNIVSSPSCTAVGNTVTCPVGPLGVGSTRSFAITVAVPNPWTGANPISNTASVDAPGDTVPANNTSTVAVPLAGGGGTQSIPTLSEWAMLLLAGLMGVLAWQRGALARGPKGSSS